MSIYENFPPADFLPFGIVRTDPKTTQTVGHLTDDGYLCVRWEDLVNMFGRRRLWVIRIAMSGQISDGVDAVDFDFDFTLPCDDPIAFFDERLLPHAKPPVYDNSFDPITIPGGGFLTVQLIYLSGLGPPFMGTQFEDVIYRGEIPNVLYDPINQAFYYWPRLQVSLVFPELLERGCGLTAGGILAIPPEFDTAIAPFSVPSIFTVSPDSSAIAQISVTAPDTAGYFGFDGPDGDVWDPDTGQQLIFPVPMTM